MRRWDLFCTVVDNFGDIGTCWRLARQLSDEHRIDVRLWVDQLDSFARLCPAISTVAAVQHVNGIEVRHWSSDFPKVDAADVVIEAFACELPATYVSAMADRSVPPVWINLEYLSAEAWVEDCQGLPSPQARPSLKKYFFFPGFTAKTGGLLRERDLMCRRAAFDTAAQSAFWKSLGIQVMAPDSRSDEVRDGLPSRDELRVSLFCYENPALPDLLECWSNGSAPVRVLVSPGAASKQVSDWLGEPLAPGLLRRRASLTVQALPFLPQAEYDQLLWTCDLNFVRGEDSFVRAQWALRPFVWQIYPQAENAHLVKLEAFLIRYLEGFQDSAVVRRCWQAWNGCGDIQTAWRDFVANRQSIERHNKDWAGQLDRLGDLADNLVKFVSAS